MILPDSRYCWLPIGMNASSLFLKTSIVCPKAMGKKLIHDLKAQTSVLIVVTGERPIQNCTATIWVGGWVVDG